MFDTTSWVRLQNTFSPAIALLLLVWIVPVRTEPISHNDPFRAIARQASKPPDPPICCLKPLPSLESVEGDLLLSFEEWKARQHRAPESMSSSNVPNDGSNSAGSENSSSNSMNFQDTAPSTTVTDDQSYVPTPELPLTYLSHFRVPLVDRFNYASLDCSARVHKAHKGAKTRQTSCRQRKTGTCSPHARRLEKNNLLLLSYAKISGLILCSWPISSFLVGCSRTSLSVLRGLPPKSG